MTEENGNGQEGAQGATLPEGVTAQITITLMHDGVVNVNYPRHEMVCRYLMDKARTIVDDEWRKLNAPLIETPKGSVRRIHG